MQKIISILSVMGIILIFSTGCHPIITENEETLANFKQNTPQNIDYDPQKYPVEIQNLNSKTQMSTLTYTHPPQRVVAFWQNSIETLIALGVGDRIIVGTGVPNKKYFKEEYQDDYEKIPYTGLENIDKETLTMLEPDFILGWHSTFTAKVAGSTEYWNSRGVNTYMAMSSSPLRGENFSKPYHSLDEEYQYILDLGKIFAKEERAHELVNQMQDEISFVVNNTQHENYKPRAIIIEFLGKEISVYGEKSLAGNILKSLNGDLLEPKVERFSFEQIIDLDPDVIFIVITEQNYGKDEMYLDRIYKNQALQDLQVVKNKRVYILPLYTIYSPGIRAYDGIKIIAQGLYPNLYEGKQY